MKRWWRSEYFSVPNLLGYFRILLIPVYLLLYFKADTAGDYLVAAAVIGISGLTDCFDGKIARRFDMVTEFGKILDPIADKLTQGALVLSLTFRYPLMSFVLLLFLVKEGYMAVMGALMLSRGRRMDGAQWCGKVCTTVLYVVMFLLILFTKIPLAAANVLMLACMGFMIYSLISYIFFYRRMWRAVRKEKAGAAENDILQEKNTKHRGKEKKERRVKKVWMAAVIILLAAGYLILGAALPYRKQPSIGEEYKAGFDADSFYGDGISSDRVMVIKENGTALNERLRLIGAAKERIILSTFAFESDEAGKDVLAALLDAAERGVDIKILADGFNSCLYMEYNPYFYALSSRPNVEIRIYNKVNLLTPWTSMGRMHDKYVIADDSAYILGGRNTFGFFLGDYEGHKNHDWDILVYNTAAGAADGGNGSSLRQVEEYFDSVWEMDVCRPFHDSERLGAKVSVKKAGNELEERFLSIRREKPELFKEYDYEKVTVPVHKITLISNPTGIGPKEPEAFFALTGLMKNAKKNVYVHTPYVVCNDMMYDSFAEVAENVPELKLMTNSAVNNGNLFAAGDYLLNKEKLLRTGMKILEYEGGISYHGKCIAIDDDMSVAGSFNMDVRSAYLDTELMLAIHSEELNASLREKMESYEDKAFQVKDVNSYEETDGMIKKELPGGKRMQLKFIRFISGWARFLL